MAAVIFVVQNGYAARDLAKAMGFPSSRWDREYRVTYPGDSLMGFRADHIVLGRELFYALTNPTEDLGDVARCAWFRENLMCRLGPDGRIVLT